MVAVHPAWPAVRGTTARPTTEAAPPMAPLAPRQNHMALLHHDNNVAASSPHRLRDPRRWLWLELAAGRGLQTSPASHLRRHPALRVNAVAAAAPAESSRTRSSGPATTRSSRCCARRLIATVTALPVRQHWDRCVRLTTMVLVVCAPRQQRRWTPGATGMRRRL